MQPKKSKCLTFAASNVKLKTRSMKFIRTVFLATLTVAIFACKNDPKPVLAPGEAPLSAEDLKREETQAIRIDSLAQSLDQIGTDIDKTQTELESAINALPQ
jgi:hypothetical protein